MIQLLQYKSKKVRMKFKMILILLFKKINLYKRSTVIYITVVVMKSKLSYQSLSKKMILKNLLEKILNS